ncbi:MAG: TraM recognition domain-containing protein [Clostridium sp.]|nr:TraM recognition domain-containing protein [Clostridium sp.]
MLIYGEIPDFQQKLSTTRSRGISCVIVCQHIAGLMSLYPNDVWQGLIRKL